MLKSNLIQYIEHTPHNFNKSVFNSLLDKYINNIQQFYKKSNLTKIEDYLYSIKYDNIDYDAGAEYAKKFIQPLGGCSSAYVNGIYGRNYDWYYNDTVSFIVQTSGAINRHASIGVAAVTPLVKDIANTLNWNDFYAVLPNLMLDGINDAGVVCNINVTATGDYGYTTGTNKSKPSLCTLMLVRYILDNATGVGHAIELLNERNWWAPHGEAFDSEVHFMIADPTTSCIVEFINNEIQIIPGDALTNFYLYDVIPNDDGTVYTPATQMAGLNAMTINRITPHGTGLERYNIIKNGLNNVADMDDMLALMKELNYTQTYTANPNDDTWYTEMAGVRDLTVVSTPEQYQPIFEKTYEMFENRTRASHDTWQTVHTSVYDTANLKMTVLCQEGTTEHEFELREL